MTKKIEQTNEVEKFTAAMAREMGKPYREQKLLEEKRNAIEAIKKACIKRDSTTCTSYEPFEEELYSYLRNLGYNVYITRDSETFRYIMQVSW